MSISNGIGNLQGLSNPVTPPSGAAATGKDEPVKAAAAPVGSAAKINLPVDQAVISSTSGLLAEALSGSDVRLEKILPIQAAISAGTYDVPSADVADKLISSLFS